MTGSIKVGTRIKPITLGFRKKVIDKYNKLILTDPDYFIKNKNKCFFTFIYNVFYFLANVFFNRARFLIGKKTSYLFGVLQLKHQKFESSNIYFTKSKHHTITKIPSLIKIADYLYNNNESEYTTFIDSNFSGDGYNHQESNALISWAWWETSHKNFIYLLNNRISRLENAHSLTGNSSRILPNHTSHLGHVGFLKKYIDFYSQVDRNRTIEIWPDFAPNKYYLQKVIDNSPLKIVKNVGKPPSNIRDSSVVDTLSYSQLSNSKWRIELSAGMYSGQQFPELDEKLFQHLSMNAEENIQSEYFLEKNRIDKHKWFVVLHVRQARENSKISVRAEDAKVENYREFCQTINELGGQVIRMGDKNFPKLTEDFPAIDYAYSDFKSDFFDTWLWANCRWWSGNFNGACVPPLTFGVPRLITDAWPWDMNGPATDIVMPKILVNCESGRELTITETLNNKLSRNTRRERFAMQNLELRDNTSRELMLAADYMYRRTQPSEATPKNLQNLRNDLAIELKVPENSSSMSTPAFFQNQLFHSFDNSGGKSL
jgi:putative glycosyltransferase (TIGR04372 family)